MNLLKIDGSCYEGEWHIFDGVKMKHGKGRIEHGNPNSSTKGIQIFSQKLPSFFFNC